MRPAVPPPGSTSRWFTATLRWLWGADDDVGLRDLVTSTPASWVLLVIFSAVSISDIVLAGSLTESGPIIERIGTSPAHMALGQWWRFVTTSLINAPELRPPANALQHLFGNALPFVLAAPRVERSVGSFKTVVLFVVATICGAVAIYVGAPFYWDPGGGTSNAVYGFIGSALVIAFMRRRRSNGDATFFGAALFVIVSSSVLAATTFPTGTNVSHLGGFIAGSVMTAVWYGRPAARRASATVAVAFVVIAGSVAAARTVDVRMSDLPIRAEIAVGFEPHVLTSGFKSIWVTGSEAGEVVRIDERTGRVSARIRYEGAGGLPVVTDHRVWVAGRRGIAAIDPTSNRIVTRIRLSGNAWAFGLAATKDALWAVVPESGEVMRVDLRTRAQSRIPVGNDPFAAVADRSSVWVASYRSQTVSRLDADSGRVVGNRRLETGPFQMALLNGSLWVGAQPFVYRLDPSSLKVIARVDVGRETWSLTPDDHGRLVVTQRFLRSIVFVDPATNRVVRRAELGLRQPISVVFRRDMWIADAQGFVLRTALSD